MLLARRRVAFNRSNRESQAHKRMIRLSVASKRLLALRAAGVGGTRIAVLGIVDSLIRKSS